jgi:DNA repair protein RAD5
MRLKHRLVVFMHYNTRLRRAVLHPSLIMPKSKGSENSATSQDDPDVDAMVRKFTEIGDSAFAEHVLEDIRADPYAESECPICLDMIGVPMLIPQCMHRW